GTLTLTNTGNNYSGFTNIFGGTLAIAADANLGSPSGALVFNGGALRTTASFSTARQVLIGNFGSGGSIDTAGNDLTLTGQVTFTGGPTGALTKLGAGTLTLSNTTNNYTGPTNVLGGVLAASAFGVLGSTSSLTVDGGTFRSVTGITYNGPVTFGAGGATLDAVAGNLFLFGTISGPGALVKTGAGTLG